jgi:hypothetical protein
MPQPVPSGHRLCLKRKDYFGPYFFFEDFLAAFFLPPAFFFAATVVTSLFVDSPGRPLTQCADADRA